MVDRGSASSLLMQASDAVIVSVEEIIEDDDLSIALDEAVAEPIYVDYIVHAPGGPCPRHAPDTMNVMIKRFRRTSWPASLLRRFKAIWSGFLLDLVMKQHKRNRIYVSLAFVSRGNR